jgi:hypothetical protein
LPALDQLGIVHTKKHNTNAQHWNQHDPEFYGILLNFIKLYEFYGPPDSLLWTTKQLTCGLANKYQLKKYPSEDDLIKEAETCSGE